MADVRLDGVTKRFRDVEAVANLSLEISDGELVVLLGPTGAGKTTTLRLVAGLEKPDDGRVIIGGEDVTAEPPAVRDVAFVFQQYSLYPHLTVYDNLAFPLRSPARRMPEDEVRKRVQTSPRSCTSKASSTTKRRACPVARCSVWPSAAHWCVLHPFTSWTNLCRRWTQSCGRSCGWS